MKFSEVAHLYLGCTCSVSASEYYESGVGKLVRVDIEDGNTVVISANTLHDRTKYCVEADIDDVKPLLRPLSDMTEEEAIQVAEICFPKRQMPTKRVFRNLGHLKQVSIEGGKRFEVALSINTGRFKISYGSAGYTAADNIAEATLYLLNQGFDLFRLLENGEALDGTKEDITI